MSQGKEKSTPAPLETDRGEQRDDNIDDLGRRPDGTEQDQPVDPRGKRPHAPEDEEKSGGARR